LHGPHLLSVGVPAGCVEPHPTSLNAFGAPPGSLWDWSCANAALVLQQQHLTPPERMNSTDILALPRRPLLALRFPLRSGTTWMWMSCVLHALVPSASPALLCRSDEAYYCMPFTYCMKIYVEFLSSIRVASIYVFVTTRK